MRAVLRNLESWTPTTINKPSAFYNLAPGLRAGPSNYEFCLTCPFSQLNTGIIIYFIYQPWSVLIIEKTFAHASYQFKTKRGTFKTKGKVFLDMDQPRLV